MQISLGHDFPGHDLREHRLRQLRRQLGRSVMPADAAAVFSSGVAAIDHLLPDGGLRHGMLVEWLAESPSGAATLSLLAAREACQAGGMLVVVDRRQTF